jgi:ADP-dependent NAD(P)H-hydrate dehydratase / NAD(P)H-hydrate epimerase
MKPVMTPVEAAALDELAEARGIAVADLMERAGYAVARACVDLTGGTYGRRAVVVCGKGNNGGDGFVAARHLARWGVRVAVVVLDDPAGLHEPTATNHARLAEVGVRAARFDRGALERELERADVVVDAIFGTGFRGVPEGTWAHAISALNGSTAPVIAVDIPSGVDGASGLIAGDAVWADLTVTFGAAKTGDVLMPGAEAAGDLRVVDIGLPEDGGVPETGLTEPDDVIALWPERAADAHKKASGTLVVVAGSGRMTGAVQLIARAAARIGAGYIIVAVPETILPVVQARLTETVFLPLPATEAGSVALGATDPVLRALEGADALALGPGLSRADETASFIRAVVRECPIPLVVDADGLNAFAGDAEGLADRKADAVLTPHLGELARLAEANPDHLSAARSLSVRTNAAVLVKGSRTVIARPDGSARINPTGSATLATAGTGDVLTGTVGGLIARGLGPFAAGWAGAYVHGVAGILAGRELGDGAVAGDVAEHLPAAVELIRNQA